MKKITQKFELLYKKYDFIKFMYNTFKYFEFGVFFITLSDDFGVGHRDTLHTNHYIELML